MASPELKILALSIPLLIVGVLLNLSVGEVFIPIGYILDPSPLYRVVILDIRLPEALAAVVVGVDLALAGATMQSIFRNPLAEPYVTGTASGALLGALLGILIAVPLGLGGPVPYVLMPMLAFLGALASTSLVVLFGRGEWLSMILAGIAVSIMFSAVVMILDTYILAMRPTLTLPAVVYLLFGTLSGVNWVDVAVMLIISTPCITYLALKTHELNLVMISDELAQSGGVEPKAFRNNMLVVTGLLTASAISFTGIIGFVGLITPHLTRFLANTSDNRRVIPLSAILGSTVMLYSNVLSKVLVPGVAIPITAITSLFGVPTLLILLRRGGGHG
ncbi:FecCD family ABC transporter permease [Vulcanisaeta thermophila]|uniref:FecCD family ABC transporter permease n=1 Tax=Vulcanisaeta thermophila TaxID=867917 RepID=UPI0009FF9AC4|nr:iron ABC transporter permease [Vulcanisaeta thermophila]